MCEAVLNILQYEKISFIYCCSKVHRLNVMGGFPKEERGAGLREVLTFHTFSHNTGTDKTQQQDRDEGWR